MNVPGCSRDTITVIAVVAFVATVALKSPGPLEAAGPENPVVIENQNEGTTAWKDFQGAFHNADDAALQVKGYASTTSAAPGESVSLYVTVNPIQTVSIDIYRIGWYRGTGGRLMQHVGPLNGVTQPPCPVDSVTYMVNCRWAETYKFNIPTNWTSGTYLAQLTNAANFQNYIPFVVRDGRPAALLYQQSVTTYQAYNTFSTDRVPRSLYTSDPRSVKVSFDRPYETNGAGHFLDFEVNFVQWIERYGYDVTYSTDIDTHARGAALLNSKAFLSVGHDEYWSREMYDAAERARDAGVSLGFFGGNPVYWQVRFESSASGVPNRVMVCYKDGSADPVQGATTTVRWREAPVNRPEQLLVGIQYSATAGYSAPDAPYIVTAPSHWVFHGTGVSDGTAIPKIVGYEIDRYHSEFPLPQSVERHTLSNSPFTGAIQRGEFSNSVIYRAPSSAWVFAAGTIRWGKGLDPGTGDPRVGQITGNVLNVFVANTPSKNPQPLKPGELPNGISAGRIVSGAVPATGIGLIVFGGGSDGALVRASGCPIATAAFWASNASGNFTTYIPGTQIAAVNAAWRERFPDGIPADTPLLVRCRT